MDEHQDPTLPTNAELSTPPLGELSFAEVTELLDVAPGTLRRWLRRFAAYLDTADGERSSHFSSRDVETLSIVRGLLAEGLTFEQIEQRLQAMQGRAVPAQDPAAVDAPAPPAAAPLPQVFQQAIQGVVETQRAILNNQTAIRELLGVVVQDNFNLKEENRKLRERMVELERALAEYQRREETRKERIEGRLRAVETTLGALQQQLAAWVQRQRERRRSWFW